MTAANSDPLAISPRQISTLSFPITCPRFTELRRIKAAQSIILGQINLHVNRTPTNSNSFELTRVRVRVCSNSSSNSSNFSFY
jgi:hypothetical protein